MKTKKLTGGDCWQARRSKILLQGGFLAKVLVDLEKNPFVNYCKSCGNPRGTGEVVKDCIELVMRCCLDSASSYDDPKEQEEIFLSFLECFKAEFVTKHFDLKNSRRI